MGTSLKVKLKRWKDKAMLRGKENRRLRQSLDRQYSRAEKWKCRYEELSASLNKEKAVGHQYPLVLVWLALWMHIDFGISLRGVSKTLVKVGVLLGVKVDGIDHVTVRNWCLKYGLYLLSRGISSGRHVLIMDESVEIGKEHLMLILGVPLEEADGPEEALRMSDVKVVGMKIRRSWKSAEASDLLASGIREHGIDVAYGISDRDGVLRNAWKDNGIVHISDCTHEMSNLAERLFTGDDSFGFLLRRMNELRCKWIMSIDHTLYVPPCLRSGNRFHKVFATYEWMRRMLDRFDELPDAVRQEVGFLRQHEHGAVATMGRFRELISVFGRIFKSGGIDRSRIMAWREHVKGMGALCERSSDFVSGMDSYLEEQRAKVAHIKRILCCSDIIESTFGKYKNKGGARIMTDDILKIPAYTDPKDLRTVKKALESITIKKVSEWKRENTTVSKLARLKSAA